MQNKKIHQETQMLEIPPKESLDIVIRLWALTITDPGLFVEEIQYYAKQNSGLRSKFDQFEFALPRTSNAPAKKIRSRDGLLERTLDRFFVTARGTQSRNSGKSRIPLDHYDDNLDYLIVRVCNFSLEARSWSDRDQRAIAGRYARWCEPVSAVYKDLGVSEHILRRAISKAREASARNLIFSGSQINS